LCWFVAFILSLAACGHLILQVWDKWDQRPVIVSFAEQSTPLWQVPFPAITICSETKTQRNVVNFTQLLLKSASPPWIMAPEERSQLGKMSLLCDLQHYRRGEKFINDSVIHFFEEVGPPFQEVLYTAKWKSKMTNPKSLFSPLLTEEGVCYTFNMLEASEMFTQEYHNAGNFLNHGNSSPQWTLDEGYTSGAGVDVYPIRALGSGAKAGITLVMSAKSDDLDYLCMGPVQGFKVLLHNPAEMPRVREQYLRVPLNQELVVRMIPSMMTTSEGLREYSPHRRQCYFPSERQLRFFKVYTQSNCALECLTNFTMHLCNCVAFHMPRNENMPICGSGSIDCMNKARDMLLLKEVEQGMLQYDTQGNSLSDCDCLQACTVLDYDSETSQADLDWRVFLPVKALNLNSSGLNIARLSVFFKDMQFITSQRTNCGGLLGLFMGFSILSLFEIVYYLTLRICCAYNWTKNNVHLLHNY
ncbi:hypothetical protein L9F63_010058, partial [Diploptera punctata]